MERSGVHGTKDRVTARVDRLERGLISRARAVQTTYTQSSD